MPVFFSLVSPVPDQVVLPLFERKAESFDLILGFLLSLVEDLLKVRNGFAQVERGERLEQVARGQLPFMIGKRVSVHD